MRKLVVAIVMLAVVFGAVPKGFSGEIDILVNKLVEKGILTRDEAIEVINEAQKEVETEVSESSGRVPVWVEKMKLKGDLRLRYEYKKKKSSVDRSRARYRFRLGITTEVIDDVKVGFGLATGGTDPRSTNQTMANSFETPDIRLDYAFAEYSPSELLTVYGGKFKRKPVLWQPSDLLWDGDINPEGVSLVLKGQSYDEAIDWFFNANFWVLDEMSNKSSDPVMYALQPGVKWHLSDNTSVETAVAYYGFGGVKGKSLDHSSGTNTVDNSGNLIYDYNSINPAIEIDFKDPAGGLLPFASVFGEYIYNFDPSDASTGYLVGLKFGDKKVKDKGQWQVKYMFRRLEKDAWLDVFPDSDAYGGDTGIKAHEVVFSYGLAKHIVFGLDYYYSENLNGAKKAENLLQANINLKF